MAGDTKQSTSGSSSTNRTRRRFLEATGAGTVVALAGCLGGGGDGDGGDGGDGGGGSGETTGNGNATTGSSGTKTIRVINSAYEPVQKVFEEIFSEFEEQEGNVEVEYNRVDFADAPQQAAQAQAAGEPWDVMNLASPGNNVTAAQEGLLQPINDVVDDRGVDYWNEKAMFKLDGDHYFAPHYGSVIKLNYRVDMFEEAGAPMPPFDNWEQYMTAAEKLTNTSKNQYGHPVFLGSNHFHGVWPMMLTMMNGGGVVNPDGDIVFDSQETAEALQFVKDMDQYSPTSAHNSSIPDMRPPLYQGQYAMTWYSTNQVAADIESYNPDLKGDVQVTHVPAPKGNEPVARMTGTGYGVSSETEHPKVAKRLVKYITERENVTRMLTANPTAKIPMVKGVLEEDAMWENDTMQEYEDLYRDLVGIAEDYGRIIAVNENPETVNPITGRALSETMVVGAAQDAVLEDMDPMDAATKWADRMREEYK
ncbi:extracellular solute-binding protein [Halorussus litoreus]|uniref:extracellular solute-binding protein n=1 Tax=Halorussus litoreus TaxID=1710536 RepID=UPI0018E59776|nr:extracellular solute-binding protein [Halorussus litoreus]